jgi:hypothetical protein
MRKYLPTAIPLACIALFIAAATFKISYPGLQNDELLWVNGALGDLDGSYIFKKIGPFPILSMPYLGAVASYLYWFVFKIFSPSIWSIRLPEILTAAFGIWGFYRLAKRHFGDRTAWMATSLLALNGAFVWATREGYSGLEFPIEVLALVFLLGGVTIWPAFFFFLLGVYYKISFVHWGCGILFACFWAYPHLRRRAFLLAVVLAASLLLWQWYVDFSFHQEVATNFAERWKTFSSFCAQLVMGTTYYNFVMKPYPGSELFGAVVPALVLAGAIAWYFLRERSAELLFLLLSLLAITAAIFMSSRAISHWHWLPILPIFILLTAYLFSRVGRLGIVFWGIYLLQLIYVQGIYFQGTERDPVFKLFSTGIYSLISFCQQDHRRCSSVEWGTHNQLLAFVQDPERVLWFGHKPVLAENIFYITYSKKNFSWPEREKFSTLAKNAGWSMEISHQILVDGEPIYDLYQLKRP